ncbi:MAG: Fic family protein, partial [Ruminococcus sp.]|nr:Fic family protein [Ruminococcus sp.]
MRKFDYTFLHDGLLPAELVNLTANIYEIKNTSNLRKKDFPKVFTELEKIAKIQSVKSSNAIEGIVTSDKRIEKIVNQNSAPINHNEAEIVGYRDALNSIHLEYENIEFTERNIINLHNILLSSANYEFAGRYKTENNLILEIDADGERNVRFKPISATQTPKAMEQMCLAYTAAASDSNINQLLLIPCVILDFLCIHPFRDGNGRMSRLLSLLLLYKNGFDIGKYVSFEEQINKYKDSYYDALKQSSQGWENGENSYIPFIRNFLSMLYMCYKELNKRFAVIDSKRITKTSRIEAVIFNSLIPVSKAEISSMLL